MPEMRKDETQKKNSEKTHSVAEQTFVFVADVAQRKLLKTSIVKKKPNGIPMPTRKGLSKTGGL